MEMTYKLLSSLSVILIVINSVQLERMIFENGTNVMLNCTNGGDWYKIDKYNDTIKLESSEKYTIENNRLKITNVGVDDMIAVYFCNSSQNETRIHVNSAPIIDLSDKNSLLVTLPTFGNTVIKCALLAGFQNHENVTWEWQFNGTVISDSERYSIVTELKGSKLNVLQMTEEAVGDYKCFAKNSIGQHSKDFKINTISFYYSIAPFVIAVVEVAVITAIIMIVDKKITKKQKSKNEPDNEQLNELLEKKSDKKNKSKKNDAIAE